MRHQKNLAAARFGVLWRIQGRLVGARGGVWRCLWGKMKTKKKIYKTEEEEAEVKKGNKHWPLAWALSQTYDYGAQNAFPRKIIARQSWTSILRRQDNPQKESLRRQTARQGSTDVWNGGEGRPQTPSPPYRETEPEHYKNNRGDKGPVSRLLASLLVQARESPYPKRR